MTFSDNDAIKDKVHDIDRRVVRLEMSLSHLSDSITNLVGKIDDLTACASDLTERYKDVKAELATKMSLKSLATKWRDAPTALIILFGLLWVANYVYDSSLVQSGIAAVS